MKVEIKRSHFAGSVYAECDCGWKCHYWEEADELEHDCLNQSENCSCCCGASETWLDCDQHPNDECYATRCDECWNITYRDCKEQPEA